MGAQLLTPMIPPSPQPSPSLGEGEKRQILATGDAMSTAATKADTVIRNANVITMDPNRPRVQALAMSNGRFIGLGSNEDVEMFVGPGVKVMDLRGKTVLPGFIDAHIHVLNSGIRHVMAADCDLLSITSILTALRERVETAAPGQWVQGFKFDDTKTAENRFLFREDLDAVSTFHPIMVSHRAGHIYYLNSMALEAAGFTRDTRTRSAAGWAGTQTPGS